MLAAAVGAFVLLVSDGDEGEDGGIDLSSATESLRAPRLGLVALYPPDWKRTERGGGELIQLKSPDRCVTVSLSSPADASDAARLLREAVRTLRRSFATSEARPLPAASVENETSAGALIAGRSRSGQESAVRVTVTRAQKLAHLTSVFLGKPPCEEATKETEAILASIEYTR